MSSALYEDFGSESEGEDFNPAPEAASDEEAADASDTEVAVTAAPKTNGNTRIEVPVDEDDDEDEYPRLQPGGDDGKEINGNGLNGNDDDEDEEEEEEDDEDDEDAVSGRPRKRSRRDPRNQFIDIEAEVDDEDEADDDDDEIERDGFIAETHPDDLADLPAGAETDDRGHRELDRKREREQQMDAEKQAQLLKERYGRRQATTSDVAVVPKRLLLPSVDDPSVWGVRAKPGKEREVVMTIMKRVEERMNSKNPMPLISAFERGGTGMVGYVYIEALKQADIFAALDGISNIYPRTKMVLVPIKEMPDLLRVTKSEQLQPGGYVRLKRGRYAGDLAQIEEVETNGLTVSLRLVPRLDYGLNEDNNAPMIDGGVHGETAKRKRQGGLGMVNLASRPPQRLFNENEAKKKHSKFLQSQSTFNGKSWKYLNDDYVNGYLIKDFRIQHLQTDNVNPTLEEVTKFATGGEDGTENLDLTALAASLKTGNASDSYLPGDTVEVFEGEQQGVYGKAVSVRGEIVTLSITEGDLRGQSIEVPVKSLRKMFKIGDHVKVIGGSRFRDEVGMVVRIVKDQITLLADLSMQEITVFSKDAREATDSGVAGGLGQYDIHDLIQLDPATVACITKVDRESLRVLDQNGSVRTIMPSQISNKIEKRRNAVATDRNGSEIRIDDTVREVGGEHKQGVIRHIYRSFLFLHNREQTEDSGIFVVRATNVATIAAKGARNAGVSSNGPDLSRMNPAMQRNGTANGAQAMPPPKSFGRDRAIGQTVTIRKGPYKGLLGIIKDTTDTDARVELHTKNKVISVPKDVLGFKDTITGRTIDYISFAGRGGRGGGGRGGFAGATPSRQPDWSGGRTPMGPAANGGRTPAWGMAARTPAYAGGIGGGQGGRTPSWKQDSGAGSRTPAWNSGGHTVNPYADGGRTAYGGAGSRTPAWDPGNRTAYGGAGNRSTASSNTNDAFSLGSKTPYGGDFGGSGGKTPAYYAPPTPAAAAPTPKFSGYAGDAPTPAGVPTPYSGNPETPAWSGDGGDGDGDGGDGDDGPRYEEGTPSP
ncbi:transcription elongation factor spt5 [Agyrium rufum]|nr:transcription elongation factor spt5 [Agyrium rufum]